MKHRELSEEELEKLDRYFIRFASPIIRQYKFNNLTEEELDAILSEDTTGESLSMNTKDIKPSDTVIEELEKNLNKKEMKREQIQGLQYPEESLKPMDELLMQYRELLATLSAYNNDLSDIAHRLNGYGIPVKDVQEDVNSTPPIYPLTSKISDLNSEFTYELKRLSDIVEGLEDTF